jgi:hypothetical protein
MALRQDGFAGDITLALKGTPRGFLLSGALIPAGQDQVRVTLTVPPLQQREPLSLAMEGQAQIQGQEVRRVAVPAENMMQAFAYWHLVPAEDWKVAIRRGGPGRAPVRLVGDQPLKISPGESVRVPIQIQLPPNSPFERILLELSEPPDGITLQEMPQGKGMTEMVIQCDAAKAKPGWKGNLIVNILGERVPPAAAPKGAARQRVSFGVLPALPLEIKR